MSRSEGSERIRKSVQVFLWVGAIMGASAFALSSISADRLAEKFHWGTDRAKLVLSILDQQAEAIQKSQASTSLDVFREIKRRALVSVLHQAQPEDLLALADQLPEGASSRRWRAAVLRWLDMKAQDREDPVAAESLVIERARALYSEAAGYRRVGLNFDATVLELWSIDLLRNFVRAHAASPDFAEAVFLLGHSLLEFRGSVPTRFRMDRVINLCTELFPDSIWALRARGVWKDEMGGA